MNKLYLLASFISFIHLIKSNDFDHNTINKFGKKLFQRLGVENKYAGISLNNNRIKKSILDNNVTKTQSHMYNLYNKKFKLRKNYNMIRSYDANPINQFLNSTTKIKKVRLFNIKNRFLQSSEIEELFKIDLNSFNHREEIINAYFDFNLNISKLIYKKLNNLSIRKSRTIYNQLNLKLILTILNKKNINNRHKKIRLISSIRLNLSLTDFINSNLSVRTAQFRFNLKNIFKSLNNTDNLVLQAKLNTELISGLRACELNNKLKYLTEILIEKPLLTIYSNDHGSSKLTFGSSLEKNQQKHSKCKRNILTIDFRQLGWDHVIIEPKILKTYYCDGTCEIPLDENSNVTNHGIMLALMGQLNQFSYLPKICCTPSKYKSHFFLILDESDSLVLKKLDDIIVDSCSCR